MIREWRHLKMLKRAGRAQDPTGAVGTACGELVVECPACPKPGVNIPEDFDAVEPDRRYISHVRSTRESLSDAW